MINDLVVTTWSHSSYSDIWKMYYDQFKECAPFFKHYMMVNEINKDFPANCVALLNNEQEKFSKRLIFSLNKIQSNNVLYMQEDFVLYDKVNEEKIKNLNDFLIKSEFSFIRLIKSGIEGGKCINKQMNLFEIPRNCHYLYSLQATIWKRKDLIKLFDFYKPESMMHAEMNGSHAARNLFMKGCYVYSGGAKRGRLHYDSNIFPYISTALFGGSHGKPARWQTSLYKKELERFFIKYNIDPKIRGEC